MSFVAGVAAANVDLLYENMPRLPAPGEEIYTDRFSLQLGGGLAATLINLGRLGVEARIATELGEDLFSGFARAEFEKNGVTPLNLYHGSKIPVNITSAAILPEDRAFLSYGKGDLQPDDAALEAFYQMATGAKLCLISPGGFLEVYKKLKAEGTRLVLDMGWDDALSFETYADVLSLADYYTPNRKEAEKLTGCADPRDAALALRRHFERVIVKADKDGCYGIDETGLFFCPARAEFRHVDSTGAGDAFLAGFCYGLFYDYPLRDCVEFGNITGGKAVTAVGALSAYVDEATLLRMK